MNQPGLNAFLSSVPSLMFSLLLFSSHGTDIVRLVPKTSDQGALLHLEDIRGSRVGPRGSEH